MSLTDPELYQLLDHRAAFLIMRRAGRTSERESEENKTKRKHGLQTKHNTENEN